MFCELSGLSPVSSLYSMISFVKHNQYYVLQYFHIFNTIFASPYNYKTTECEDGINPFGPQGGLLLMCGIKRAYRTVLILN